MVWYGMVDVLNLESRQPEMTSDEAQIPRVRLPSSVVSIWHVIPRLVRRTKGLCRIRLWMLANLRTPIINETGFNFQILDSKRVWHPAPECCDAKDFSNHDCWRHFENPKPPDVTEL